MSPLLAKSGQIETSDYLSAFDPKRTLAGPKSRSAAISHHRISKIQNNSGLSQGLCGRTARHSCYGVNSQNRPSRREREHGSSPGLFESKERRALVLLRRGYSAGWVTYPERPISAGSMGRRWRAISKRRSAAAASLP